MLTTKALYAKQKGKPLPDKPCRWNENPIVGILEDQRRIAKAKKRLVDLDVLIARIYEDAVLGNLSKERYQKMSQSYEGEQERVRIFFNFLDEVEIPAVLEPIIYERPTKNRNTA